jgi:lipopolysaccharide assembly outer membrane protein LptD (OstA)
VTGTFRISKILILGASLALPARSAGQAQRTAAADTAAYRVSTGSFRSTVEEGERINYLEGGVRIDHQTTTITSNRGKQYQDREHTLLIEDVRVTDGTLRMFGDLGEHFGASDLLTMDGNVRSYDRGWEIRCDHVEYNRATRVAILTGNLRLSDSTRVMYADSIYYDRDAETAEAVGNVVLIDEVENYSIAGDHATYDRMGGAAIVDENPILTFDLQAEEKGMVVSRLMRFDITNGIGTAVDSVAMAKGQTRASCDSAVIYNEEGRVELFGNPRAFSRTSSMSGERMQLLYNEEGIERVIIPENGRLTESPGEGSPWREDSWIEGDSVVIYLSEEKVDSVRIIGDSKAMYYPVEEEQGKVSNNYSVGDTMLFRFTDEELNYVEISGKASGVYNFINLSAQETIDSIAASIDSSLVYRRFDDHAQNVEYKAGRIEYFAARESIVLKNNAIVEYQNKSLSAQNIDFNSRMNVLEAVGNPVLEESGQKMYGFVMGYDMESEAGLVTDGSTKYQEGYYLGERIFKVGDDILKVYGSKYTTCSRKKPHYTFRAKKMKVFIDDKIVSGPITMYFGEVPVFYLPFMANSIRRDRHSGFLRPNFDIGINSRDGRFLRGVGYYWATNDYTDFLLTTDFNEERNFRIHLTNRYNVRYLFNGDAHVDFFRDLRDDTNEWKFTSKHKQDLGRNSSLNASLSFVSSDRALSAIDRSKDVQNFVDRRIQSSVSYRKAWGNTKLSFSANRVQKLDVTSPSENRVTMQFPTLSLNFPTTSLWPLAKHAEGEQGIAERVLRGFTFAPNLRMDVSHEESEQRTKRTAKASSGASFRRQMRALFLNVEPAMSLNWNYHDVLEDDINLDYVEEPTSAVYTGDPVPTPTAGSPLVIDGSNDRLRINVDGTQSGEIFIAQGSYTSGDLLATEMQNAINADAGLGSSDVVVVFSLTDTLTTGQFSFRSLTVGSTSVIEFLDQAVSPIYGPIGVTINIQARGTNYSGPVKDLTYKNELTMRLSAALGTTVYGTFNPNIGPLRGIRHTFNPTVSYSYTPQLTRSQVSNQSVSYSIRNAFDLKVLEDSTEVKKNNVLTWNLSGSYDPDLPKNARWSTISSSIRTGFGRYLSFRVSQTYDPYKKKIMMTSINAGLSLHLNGAFSYPGSWEVEEEETIKAAEGDIGTPPVPEDFSPTEAGAGHLPWSFKIDYTVSQQSRAGGDPYTDSQISMSGMISLTTNWKITYSSYYNVQEKEFTNYQYAISRDLHCWRASFVHRQFADDWSYYFQIAIKAHPDVMYERGPRELMGFGGY